MSSAKPSGLTYRMSTTPVPISMRLVRAPIAASSGAGVPNWRAKGWTRKYAPSTPTSSAARASSPLCSSEPDAVRTAASGGSTQWPKDRQPTFLLLGAVRERSRRRHDLWQPRDVTHHHYRRWPDPVGLDGVRQGGESATVGRLALQAAVNDHRRRGGGRTSARDERLGDDRAVPDPHQQDDGPVHAGERLPVRQGIRVTGREVPRDHGDFMGHPPVGDRDTGETRHPECARDPGDDRARDPGPRAGRGLLVPPAVEEGVPTLEPHDELARPGPVDEDLVDRL